MTCTSPFSPVYLSYDPWRQGSQPWPFPTFHNPHSLPERLSSLFSYSIFSTIFICLVTLPWLTISLTLMLPAGVMSCNRQDYLSVQRSPLYHSLKFFSGSCLILLFFFPFLPSCHKLAALVLFPFLLSLPSFRTRPPATSCWAVMRDSSWKNRTASAQSRLAPRLIRTEQLDAACISELPRDGPRNGATPSANYSTKANYSALPQPQQQCGTCPTFASSVYLPYLHMKR